jgi:hypothetical protein
VLVDLGELELSELPFDGVPGGLPPQLTKLTALNVCYTTSQDAAQQLQHLSSLSALQNLALEFNDFANDFGLASMRKLQPGDLAGVSYLSQLTSLKLSSHSCALRTDSSYAWDHLTGLERLELCHCGVKPEVLAAFTRLRSLKFFAVAVLRELLPALCKLQLLTQLDFGLEEPAIDVLDETAVSTACHVSTNLCSVYLSCAGSLPQRRILFSSAIVYPHLRHIDLECYPGYDREDMAITAQKLQQLHDSCPAVESLAFALCHNSPTTALTPLLQLSALTSVGFKRLGAGAAAAVDVAAQLTKLRQLTLQGLPQLTDPALLQLSALTALQKLELEDESEFCFEPVLYNKVGVGDECLCGLLLHLAVMIVGSAYAAHCIAHAVTVVPCEAGCCIDGLHAAAQTICQVCCAQCVAASIAICQALTHGSLPNVSDAKHVHYRR